MLPASDLTEILTNLAALNLLRAPDAQKLAQAKRVVEEMLERA
jgi:hypothetical protein